MNWFEKLFGFAESTAAVRRYLSVNGEWLHSTANSAAFRCGTLEIPNLGEMRQRTAHLLDEKVGRTKFSEVVGSVQDLHEDVTNRGAIFQVASQCNLLEMVGPSVTPDAGITGYFWDRTQGPACAIAAGAGTVYRNYFVPVEDSSGKVQIGQTAQLQVDTMQDLHAAWGGSLWEMQNGYLFANSTNLQKITARLAQNPEDGLEHIRVGVHRNVQVTLASVSPDQIVHQIYCSAMPVAYSRESSQSWEAFARLVLRAAYEITLLAAVEESRKEGGSNRVFLTLLGGGAFGNQTAWIMDAIWEAMQIVKDAGLDVAIVSYGRSNPDVQKLIGRW